MLRRFVAVGSFVAMVVGTATAGPSPLRMPPGTRSGASEHLVSGRGLRDTIIYFAKQLARLGIANRQVGPYRTGGVEVTRFISEAPATNWLAIHIWRTAGKTMIFVVPRAPLDEPPPDQ